MSAERFGRAYCRLGNGISAVSGVLLSANGSPTLLVVSNKDVDGRLIRGVLAHVAPSASPWSPSAVERARGLEGATARVAATPVHAAFVDMVLPDSQGIGTFEALLGAAPQLPIYVVARASSQALAHRALALGARGVLLEDQQDRYHLPRILAYVAGR